MFTLVFAWNREVELLLLLKPWALSESKSFMLICPQPVLCQHRSQFQPKFDNLTVYYHFSIYLCSSNCMSTQNKHLLDFCQRSLSVAHLILLLWMSSTPEVQMSFRHICDTDYSEAELGKKKTRPDSVGRETLFEATLCN